MIVDLYRNGSVIEHIPADETSYFQEKIMAERLINVTCHTISPLNMAIGDYVIYAGENFYINTLPNEKKNNSHSFDYTIVFESTQYYLGKVQLMLNGEIDFPLFGTANAFVDLIVSNLNRESSGWTKGTVGGATYAEKNIQFTNENCLQVIDKIAKEYNVEWYIDNKVVNLVAKGSAQNYTFKYGEHKGLYEIARNTVDSKNIVTRLYAFGSDKNIPSDYRSGAKRLRFSYNGHNYVESNVSTYGVIERSQIFDDIFPARTGTISTVDATHLILTDSSMNFDLNSYMLPGVAPKFHFQTGDLSGYEFELVSYVHATKTFTLKQFKDEQGTIFPTASLYPRAGDTYKLLDIKLPQSYIDTAETALLARAQSYLSLNSSPYVSYEVKCDPLHFKELDIALNCGDSVTITDSDLGVNKSIRIISLKRNLFNVYDYSLDLSDIVYRPTQVSILQNIVKLLSDTKKDKVADVYNMRRKLTTEYTAKDALAEAISATGITDNFVSIIGGVATGNVMMVGNEEDGINAGLSGLGRIVGSLLDSAVRLFAGKGFADRETAPCMILDDGTVILGQGTYQRVLLKSNVFYLQRYIDNAWKTMIEFNSTTGTSVGDFIPVISLKSIAEDYLNGYWGLKIKENVIGYDSSTESFLDKYKIDFLNRTLFTHLVVADNYVQSLKPIIPPTISHVDVTSPVENMLIVDTYQGGNHLARYKNGSWITID